ncbi:S-layer family protein [Aetokthonos hydrillicola Thurmond2011]|uniref:S-layer family protein n=1 Tax=Aetokthonos hydrillicola Thurmond2011 TaxID=2712845 RepID=A0AAP5I3A4_9CYAN|nr:S-layer family protein [Aetokthonos hydrillicola]MBO3457340.1 S-layer family protein [Aetokthonos hydrillicola CCALA 1050]MDR9893984.1 S-layer family protein [Aetokthonos hydrillicola Thurmond2011]
MMNQTWRSLFLMTLPLAILGYLASSNAARAQITPDKSLGSESSVVTPNILINGVPSDRIDGGATRGNNLFHSFQDFNINAGRGAYFSNPTGIDNIISRVTGGNPSNIFGTLGVLGKANLFFINPNGIIFGSNARLDLNGSFLASTANSLIFNNGFEFSTTNPQAPPLLTVNIPIGLKFRDNPGSITNQSTVGLQVDIGKSLALVGGNVNFEGGTVIATGGRVELGGLAGEGTVGINNDSSLSFPENLERADLSLTKGATVNVVGEEGGNIVINAHNLEISGESNLLAGIKAKGGFTDSKAGDILLNATGNIQISSGSHIENIVDFDAIGEGGSIVISAGSVSVLADGRTRGTELITETRGVGNAGQIKINTRDTLSFKGFFADASSAALGYTIGNSGSIDIRTGSLFLIGGGQLDTNNYGQGNAGEIKIVARDSVVLDGNLSEIRTEAIGDKARGADININTGSLFATNGGRLSSRGFQANAGNINITAQNIVALEGRGSDIFPAGILTSLGSPIAPVGKVSSIGGNININAGSILVSNGSQINSSTFQRGNAGNVSVFAKDSVVLDNGYIVSNIQSEEGIGKGGSLNINAGSVALMNGAQVNAFTRGHGDAGNVTITARDTVLFDGFSDGFPSAAFSSVEATGVGNGGSININAGSVSLKNGAQVNASTRGHGDAGSVTINASNDILFDGTNGNSGVLSIVSATGIGKGGSINIYARSFSLTNGASVSTRSLNSGYDAGNVTILTGTLHLDKGFISAGTLSGNGGNIALKLHELLLLRHNSKVSTSAGTSQGAGNGGNITINSPLIVAFPSENSDITANAFAGTGGRVSITTQGIFGIKPLSRTQLERRLNTTDLSQLDPSKLHTSDITAISQQNPSLSGIVAIDAPEVDPSKGLIQLPENVIDPSQQIAQNPCKQSIASSEFISTGRGGLPPNPNEALSNEGVRSHWIEPTSTVHSLTEVTKPSQASIPNPKPQTFNQLVPAQGWVFNNKGQVVLTAYNPTSTGSQRSRVNSGNCPAR